MPLATALLEKYSSLPLAILEVRPDACYQTTPILEADISVYIIRQWVRHRGVP